MTNKVVTPRQFSGNSATLLFWKAGPMFTIECGNCPAMFRERVPIIENPKVQCPDCGAWNLLPLEPA